MANRSNECPYCGKNIYATYVKVGNKLNTTDYKFCETCKKFFKIETKITEA